MRLQARDKMVMQWINGFGFATVAQVQQKMNVGPTAAHVRMRKLVDAGYLKRRRILNGQARIHLLTRYGQYAAGDDLKPLSNIALATFEHDLKLVDLNLHLSALTGESFIPERRLKHTSALGALEAFRHMPDGILELQDKRIAVELELAVKARRRLHDIMKAYMGNFEIDEVWYFVGNQRVANAVSRAAYDIGFQDISIRHF